MGIALIIGRVVEPEKLTYPILKNSFIRPKSFQKIIKKISSKLVKISELNSESTDYSIIYEGGTYDQFFSYLSLPLELKDKVAIAPTTAFIGTKNYPLIDKFLIAIYSFSKLGLKIPPFTFLDELFQKEIEVVAPKGEINSRSTSILIQALLRATPQNRVVAIQYFGEVLKDALDIPEDRIFMDKNELSNFTGEYVTYSHSGSNIFDLGLVDGLRDLTFSSSLLNSSNKVYLPVGYSVPSDFLPFLKTAGFKKIILSANLNLTSYGLQAIPGVKLHEDNLALLLSQNDN